jgi:hypothetical protein
VLDIVLVPIEPFPLDLIDFIRKSLDLGKNWYLSRQLMLSGENAARRISVVIPRSIQMPDEYVDCLMEDVPVFKDMKIDEALAHAETLGSEIPGARIVGDITLEQDMAALTELAGRADPEAVVFASRQLERWWTANVIGSGSDQ